MAVHLRPISSSNSQRPVKDFYLRDKEPRSPEARKGKTENTQ